MKRGRVREGEGGQGRPRKGEGESDRMKGG